MGYSIVLDICIRLLLQKEMSVNTRGTVEDEFICFFGSFVVASVTIDFML